MFFISKESWEVKKTSKKGRGIFAKKDILPGTLIGDYLGKVIRTADEETIDDGDNFYLMYYHDQASVYPDHKKPGIHLLNHSCAPNCWMTTYRGHTLFFALRHIFAGEELTISYLLSPQDETCAPCTHICHCNSINCTQSMHLTKKRYKPWSAFTDAEAKATKRERVRYGKHLKKLSSYPENIPDNPIYVLFGSHENLPVTINDLTLPSKSGIRHLLRQHGRRLLFSKIGIEILGVTDDIVFSQTTK